MWKTLNKSFLALKIEEGDQNQGIMAASRTEKHKDPSQSTERTTFSLLRPMLNFHLREI